MSFDLPDTDTVYVSGLPPGTSEDEVAAHFGSIGIIKNDKKKGGKKIWLYKVHDAWLSCNKLVGKAII